jgi:hypothetical protein
MNGVITYGPYTIRVVGLDLIDLAPVNARGMAPPVFHRLVQNIKADKALSQIPFCVYRPAEGRYTVLSGNHRVSAAKVAGLTETPIIYVHIGAMDAGRQTALQIAHNSIHGTDDVAKLKQLYDTLPDANTRDYAALSEKALKSFKALPAPVALPVTLPGETAAVTVPDAIADAPKWVKVADIIGGATMPPEAAGVVLQAVNEMVKTGDVPETAKWRALELWAADYLSS